LDFQDLLAEMAIYSEGRSCPVTSTLVLIKLHYGIDLGDSKIFQIYHHPSDPVFGPNPRSIAKESYPTIPPRRIQHYNKRRRPLHLSENCPRKMIKKSIWLSNQRKEQNIQHPAADRIIAECLSTRLEGLVYPQ